MEVGDAFSYGAICTTTDLPPPGCEIISPNDPFLQYVNFERHQQGLRKEREDPSPLPPPSGRFPVQFEPYLSSALYQPRPKNAICVGDAAAQLPPALESSAQTSELDNEVPRSDSADLGETLESSAQTSEGNSEVPRGDSEAPDEVGGISLSRSLSLSSSSSLRRRRRRRMDDQKNETEDDEELSGDDSQTPDLEQTTATTAASENRLKNFMSIKTKLGPRRKRSPEDEQIDLITECLAEDDSRDLWFDLPHARVQEAIRDSTASYRKGGQFKTEFIAALDKATRTLRASVSPAKDTFDIPHRRMGAGDG